MTDLYKKRFAELAQQTDDLRQGAEKLLGNFKADDLHGWTVKVRNLLKAACGPDSEHYTQFIELSRRNSFEDYYDVFRRLRSVFLAAREDYEGGYLRSYRSLVRADVFDSELEQARELYRAGYLTAAAVIGFARICKPRCFAG